jgi:hypothetical protein
MHADKTIAFSLPDPTIAQSFTHDRDENANSVEGQLLWRAPKVKLVAGAGYFDIGAKETTVFAIDDPDFGIQDTTLGDSKIKHTNLYAYAYWSPVKELTLTLGASGDLFDETGTFTDDVTLAGLPPTGPTPVEPPPVLGEKNQFNPKLGVSYTTSSGTTLRGTWFRALKRTLVTDQTLEPTQVAGFNQFFDDPSATKSDVWGLAIDQKLGRRAFAGGEYSERDLTIPILILENGVTWTLNEFDGKEKTARAYLFGTPHPWVTLGAEYSYENFDRDPGLQGSYTTVKTHRVPLSVRIFHPSGFSAYLGTTYLKQEGEFRTQVPLSNDFVPGKRDFWIVDAAVRYRLPKRYGFVAAGVNNLTDETSTYEATDPKNLGIRPGRVVYARVVVALP